MAREEIGRIDEWKGDGVLERIKQRSGSPDGAIIGDALSESTKVWIAIKCIMSDGQLFAYLVRKTERIDGIYTEATLCAGRKTKKMTESHSASTLA